DARRSFWRPLRLMLDLIISREMMIVSAIIGGALSLLASMLQKKVGEDMRVRCLVWSGYGFMGFSMGIFVFVGLLGAW
ncbi:MAG: hypothetical protein ABR558_01720, partial [Thioalkalivibrio sp.]